MGIINSLSFLYMEEIPRALKGVFEPGDNNVIFCNPDDKDSVLSILKQALDFASDKSKLKIGMNIQLIEDIRNPIRKVYIYPKFQIKEKYFDRTIIHEYNLAEILLTKDILFPKYLIKDDNLFVSPECINFSNAKCEKPRNPDRWSLILNSFNLNAEK